MALASGLVVVRGFGLVQQLVVVILSRGCRDTRGDATMGGGG